MPDAPSRLGGLLLNVGLAFGGVLVLVLLYGLATRAFTPTANPVRQANPTGLMGDIVQVEVLNGCGVSGIAGTATSYLRDHDFDVVGSGNYVDFDQPHSLVLDRVGNREAALAVAAALGIDEEHVSEELNEKLYVDASIVLGRDYQTLRAFEDVNDAAR